MYLLSHESRRFDWTIGKSRRSTGEQVQSSVVGEVGQVVTELAPRGQIRLRNELWTAVAEGQEPIEAGRLVTVMRVDGVILTVGNAQDDDSARLGAPEDDS